MTVIIHDKDALNVRVECEAGIAYELSEHFSFEIKDAKFNPKVKLGVWDGIIRMFNPIRKTIYAGLAQHVIDFCTNAGYPVDDRRSKPQQIDLETLKKFYYDNEILTEDMPPRDYQWQAVLDGINNPRRLLISPTSSGKSLIIFMLIMWHMFKAAENDEHFKVLVVVPTISLTSQMSKDFDDYYHENFMLEDRPDTRMIKGGADKSINGVDIVISTWQSAAKMEKSWMEQFSMVIGDEAHLFAAKSLVKIMTDLKNANVRIGCTGTLDGERANKMTLEGLFGPVNVVTTTHDLMEAGHVAKLKIKAICASYNDADSAFVRTNCKVYQDEVTFLVTHENRNKFIAKLATSLEGNTLLLFVRIEHGKILHEMIKSMTDRPVYLIYGKTDDEAREEIRELLKTEKDAIVIASAGTTSTGTNIPSLMNMILAHPSKSRIRTLQSIGRTLRLHKDKDWATVFDIADDFRKNGKGKANHTLRHFIERVRYYDEQRFDLTISKYKVK